MALSSYDKKLSSSQQAAINKAKNDYNAAMAKGDKAGMNAAHEAAESIRAQAGYSGGGDGSGYTKLPSIWGTGSNHNNINKVSSGGSTSSNTGTTSTKVNYGGQSFDMNTDYQKQINEANARGDYATAKNLEAIRNAKINYMNSIGVNKDGWTATNNYNFNSFSDLPSNWTSANIGGNNYINQDGRYYDSDNNFLGTGWNANTGSFTYNNRQDAANAAYNYIASLSGLDKYGLSAEDYMDYYGNNISSSFIDAMQTGDVDSWQQWRAEQKRQEQEWLASLGLDTPYYDMEDIYTPKDENALNGNLTGAQNNYASNLNDYLDYISKQLGKNRVSVY